MKELAGLRGLSATTVTRILADVPGVMGLANVGPGKRRYTTLCNPESVVSRAHEKLSKQPLAAALPRSNPLRVFRLGHHADVPARSSRIIKPDGLQ